MVTEAPAGTVIELLSKAIFCAVRAIGVPPAGEAVAAGLAAGEAVAEGDAVNGGTAAGDAVAAGDATVPEGITVSKAEATTGGFNGV